MLFPADLEVSVCESVVFRAEMAGFPVDSVHESVLKPKIREEFHSYMNYEIVNIPSGRTFLAMVCVACPAVAVSHSKSLCSSSLR